MGNIQFNSIKEIGLPMDSTLGIVGLPEDAIAENGGIINAVQIDWNGATLDNVELAVLDNKNTINTTGQLLALINDLQEQINAIVYIMNGGNTGGDNGNGTSPVQSPTPTPTPTPTPSTTSPITTTP